MPSQHLEGPRLIHLCDEVTIGQFGKMNLMGLNPGDTLTISGVPYTLSSCFLLQGKVTFQEEIMPLMLEVKQTADNEKVLFKEKFALPPLPRMEPGSSVDLFMAQPVQWMIREYGRVTVTLLQGDATISEEIFQVVKGAAPSLASSSTITSSGLVSEKNGFILEQILRSTCSKLVLIDRYLHPDPLRKLLSVVPDGIDVAVLTGDNLRKVYRDYRKIIGELKFNLDVRFSDRFHDRYVIVNETEFYHFGYSLKDLSRNKVSRYAKLYRKDEIDELWYEYTNHWNQAEHL